MMLVTIVSLEYFICHLESDFHKMEIAISYNRLLSSQGIIISICYKAVLNFFLTC